MDERDTGCAGVAVFGGSDRRRDGSLAATDDHDALAGLLVQRRGVLEEACAAMAVEPLDLQSARLERAHSTRDDERGRDEARAGRGFDVEAAVVASCDSVHQLPQMQAAAERLYLLRQALDQFAAGAERQARDVVDGLVGVQLDALAASVRQRVDEMAANFLQAELENLEQADRAGADDQRIRVDRLCRGLDRRHVTTGSAARACRSCLSTRRHRPAGSCVA